MRTVLLFALYVVACSRTEPRGDTKIDAAPNVPASLPKAAAAESDAGTAATENERVRDTVRRWNEAHAKRDAKALESIYAEKVNHYGTEMKRDAVVKAKAAAFAAAPDFTQVIGTIELEPYLNPGQTMARVTKKVTQKGQTKNHYAALVIFDGRVEEEMDDVDWCRRGDGSGTSERTIAPFTMSGSEAVLRAYETKHMKEQQKKRSGLVIDVRGISCPKVCAKPSYECGFHVRTSDLSATTESNLVEWLYIDPIEKKLWFPVGESWQSEPLPPLPAK